MHLVDIWNVIEVFREAGWNSPEVTNSDISVAGLRSVLTSLYAQLNKRLPSTSTVDTDHCLTLLSAWLTMAYDQWVLWHPSTIYTIRLRKDELSRIDWITLVDITSTFVSALMVFLCVQGGSGHVSCVCSEGGSVNIVFGKIYRQITLCVTKVTNWNS